MDNLNDPYADSTLVDASLPPDVGPPADVDTDPHAVANSPVVVYEWLLHQIGEAVQNSHLPSTNLSLWRH